MINPVVDRQGAGVRERVLQTAGQLLAAGEDPAKLGVAQVVATGVCDAGGFAELFPDRSLFLRELLLRLFADARDAVIRVTAGMKPGIAQLATAFETYLDYNLAHPQLQALAHQVQLDPVGLEALNLMEAGVALIAQSELKSAGADHCGARGKLLTAMAIYTVRAEYRAGKSIADLRAALLDYCRLSVA